ncbi:MAG: phosphoribosylglycinamide formyltransferase [Woeseiaceae bacterium]|nr:phosphoribosylglycinamide formyltransferase [Woeseiaceae bacterium]
MATRCKTAILISGSGTNLQAFIDYVAGGASILELSVVLSNRPDAFGLIRASNAGIPTVCLEHGQFASRDAFDRAVAAKLDAWQPDLLVLAGFMRILSAGFVARYAGRILNIHPALLPAYPGLDTHQRVLDAGDEWHGSTVHFVTEELDGGPRILQGRLPVITGETADQLAARVQAIEHQIYPEAADWVGEGRVEFRNGETWIDGVVADEPVVHVFDRTGKKL